MTINKKTQLSPIYDFVNSTIINEQSEEELALSLGNKKSGFSKSDFLVNFGEKRLV